MKMTKGFIPITNHPEDSNADVAETLAASHKPRIKMTKKLEEELWTILGDLRRGLAYVKREDVAIALRCKLATTTRHYTQYHPTEPKHLYEVEKFVGSDLCGIFDAHDKLKKLLGGV